MINKLKNAAQRHKNKKKKNLFDQREASDTRVYALTRVPLLLLFIIPPYINELKTIYLRKNKYFQPNACNVVIYVCDT